VQQGTSGLDRQDLILGLWWWWVYTGRKKPSQEREAYRFLTVVWHSMYNYSVGLRPFLYFLFKTTTLRMLVLLPFSSDRWLRLDLPGFQTEWSLNLHRSSEDGHILATVTSWF
jgi:hypothetical protein